MKTSFIVDPESPFASLDPSSSSNQEESK